MRSRLTKAGCRYNHRMAYEFLGDEKFDSSSGDALLKAFKAAAADGTGGCFNSASDSATYAAVRAGAAATGRFRNILNEMTSGNLTTRS